jgi:predicted RNA binding protein YcfA (HicA-like mRNA interferase family)
LPRLRRLGGQEVVRILRGFGFEVQSQRGSHVKLRRIATDGTTETLTIPNHAQLDTGTCRAILRQAARYVPLEALRPQFYSE